MAREKKTRKQLEAMIWDRCLQAGMKLESVKVFPSRRELWEASYQADPRLYTELRDTYATQFERIVDDLRASCDLGAQAANPMMRAACWSASVLSVMTLGIMIWRGNGSDQFGRDTPHPCANSGLLRRLCISLPALK
jgi:hypothetical protein